MQFLLEVQVYILTSVSPRVSIGASNEEWFKVQAEAAGIEKHSIATFNLGLSIYK